jgi:hypothetical protein
MVSEMAMSPIPTWDSPPTPSLMMVRQLVNFHVATQIQRVRKTMQFVVAVLGGLSTVIRYGEGQKSGREQGEGGKGTNEVAMVTGEAKEGETLLPEIGVCRRFCR